MRETYILATVADAPVSIEEIRSSFESENVKVTPQDEGRAFVLSAEEVELTVRFEARAQPLGWSPDLITGSDEAKALFNQARGFYRLSFEPGHPQPSVAVFEALWCARTLMEHVEGVLLDLTAFKLHDGGDVTDITELDFDIRDHVNLHAVEATTGETPLWVHSHGMEKFGQRDVEIFHLAEADLLPAEAFLHELCTDMAFGQGPPERAMVETSNGGGFMVVPSDEARVSLMGLDLELFEGHEGLFFTVVSPEGRHNISEILRPYRERFEEEDPEKTEELKTQAQRLLPAFKARYMRKGLMEPLTFLVRGPFLVHPETEPVVEHLWAEVAHWEEGKVIAKLVDGAMHTTEWRKGAHVEIEESDIEAIAVGRDGRTLEEEEMMELLVAERPS